MRRVLAGVVVLELGCVPASQPTTPPTTLVLTGLPEATRPEPKPLAWNELRLIEQLEPPAPEGWRFDPRSTRIAAELGECGVWELTSGRYLGSADASPERPCETWPAAIPITQSQATPQPPQEIRRRQVQGDLHLALARSDARGQLAVLVADHQHQVEVEIWDIGAAQPLDERPIPTFEAHEEAPRGRLLWSGDTLVAIAEYDDSPFERANVLVWSLGRGSEYFLSVGGEFDTPGAFWIDPQSRWLFVDDQLHEPRMSAYQRIDAYPLWPEIPAVLGLPHERRVDDVVPDGHDDIRSLGWSDTVGSTYSLQSSTWDTSSEEPDDLDVAWLGASFLVQPDGHVVVDVFEDSYSIEDVIEYRSHERLIAGDLVLADLDVCTQPADQSWRTDDHVEAVQGPVCEHTRAGPEGCEIVDASWSLDEVLLACADRWQLVPVDEGSLVLDDAREIDRGTTSARVAWSRSALVVWTPDAGLRRHGGPSWSQLVRSPTLELVRARLDEEVEQLLVREHGVLHSLDLRSDTLGPALAWPDVVEHAAFSPDGRMLALAGATRIEIFVRDRAEPLVRIESGPIAGLAFRQDSLVLFVGRERSLPELALDPTSGVLVRDAQLDTAALERIARAELDPSWRWAIEEDGTVLRTLDGQALHLRGDDALLESGWLVGDDPWREYAIHVGPEGLEPVYDVASFTDQLSRPNLVADFFDGRPLPRPRLARHPRADEP